LNNSAGNFVERYLKPSTIIIIILTAANIFMLASVFGVDIELVSGEIPLLITTTGQGYLYDPFNSKLETDDGWRTVHMRVSAYCPCRKCCGKHSDGVTASAHRIRGGDMFVAADNRYDFKTEFIIPGYNESKPVEVLDRGSAIKGNRLDVFFHSHEEAMEWGLKYIDVKVRQ
jgi:3D (Asp-Asp-Asp) domain-containing protein